MTLTEHQSSVEDEIIAQLKDGEKRILLKGSAGTGKTTTMNSLIKRFKVECYKYGIVYVTAPTHKALAVLRTKVEHLPYIEFATIHSALKLKRSINKKTGEETFVKSKYNPRYPPLDKAVLLIIDESSMLSTELLNILDDPEFSKIPMIFVGDSKQIQPVNEDDSPVFVKDIKNNELKEIVRQGKDNPVIDLSYSVCQNLRQLLSKEDNATTLTKIQREEIKTIEEELTNWNDDLKIINDTELALYGYDDDIEEKSFIERTVEYLGGYVYTNDRIKIIERLAEVNGTDEMKYLAWTNAEVDKMNNQVRLWIKRNGINVFNEERTDLIPDKVEINETIVLQAPFNEFHTNQEIKIYDRQIQMNEFIVPTEDTEFTHIDGTLAIKQIPIKDSKGNYVKDDAGNYIYPYLKVQMKIYRCNGNLIILHEDSEAEFAKYIKQIELCCKQGLMSWEAKFFFKEQVVDFKYNHASSIHKSQGSTYRKAIINVGNINSNQNMSEKKRLLYTAITRASELVILYNVK